MCFDHDSGPPIALGERAFTAADLTLTARDGNQFSAYEANGAEKSNAAIVVLPDVRGLFSFYKDLTECFAGAGHDAIAIDYFGRTTGMVERTNDWEFWPHVYATTFEGVRDDVTATVSRLRAGNPGAARLHGRILFRGVELVASSGQRARVVRGHRVLRQTPTGRGSQRADRQGARHDLSGAGLDGGR